jgi:uncharacterized protein YqgC (DUF456 family)
MNLSLLWWILVVALMLLGLVGTVVPLLPGAALILGAAFLYEWVLAEPGHTLGWVTLTGLAVLTVLSYVVDLVSAVWGAQKFGASRSGMIGGLVGLIVGLFFNLPGLILGPPLGVIAGELVAGQEFPVAVRVAWGTVVGTAAGMAVRLGIATVMVVWFLVVALR